MYKKALDMTAQAPQLHAELQKQIAGSQVRDVCNVLLVRTSTALCCACSLRTQ